MLNILIHYFLIFCFPLNTTSHINFLADFFQSSLITTQAESLRLSWLVWSSIFSILVVPKAWTIIYTLHSKKKLNVKSTNVHNLLIIKQILKDSPLDSFLLDATMHTRLVMLSMSDRKVYVGYLGTMGEPNEIQGADQEVSIQPVMSGYRCKDNLTVTFTTPYDKVKSECESGQSLITTLKQENIVSASLFDQDVFKRFGSHSSSLQDIVQKCPSGE